MVAMHSSIYKEALSKKEETVDMAISSTTDVLRPVTIEQLEGFIAWASNEHGLAERLFAQV